MKMQHATPPARSRQRRASRLFLLLVGTTGLLRLATELLRPVLALLALLPAGLLDLVRLAVPHQSVMGLESLHRLAAVVDEGKARALAATILSPEAEDGDLVLAALVQFGELGAELVLGDVRAVGVQDVND